MSNSLVPRLKETVRARVRRHIAYLCTDALQAEVTLRDLSDLHDRLERAIILGTLEGCYWNIRRAARTLGLHRNTLSRLMRWLGISKPRGSVRQKCRCGREMRADCFGNHMRWHVRRGDARLFLPEESDRFEYKWLRQPEAA